VVLISLSSLYPDASDRRFRESPAFLVLKHRLWISFDGKPVLDSELEAHPSTAGQIALFHNFIGMSTAIPEFTGRVLSQSSATPDEVLAAFRTTSPSHRAGGE
jgi:hypothetical protein